MKETGKVFGVLQRVGRAFMLPIAVLPVAGLLLGIGRSLTNETMLRAYHLMKIMGPGTILYGVIKVGSDCGSIIFGNDKTGRCRTIIRRTIAAMNAFNFCFTLNFFILSVFLLPFAKRKHKKRTDTIISSQLPLYFVFYPPFH